MTRAKRPKHLRMLARARLCAVLLTLSGTALAAEQPDEAGEECSDICVTEALFPSMLPAGESVPEAPPAVTAAGKPATPKSTEKRGGSSGKTAAAGRSKVIVSDIYKVVSPVGLPTVEPIRQGKRLDTLAGKTIAVVGGSFMAGITHPEIRRLIREKYPTAKVLLLDEIGSAGVYPAPGIRRRQSEEFQARLKEMRVDAVISGNGGCGLCTPKEAGSCIAAEHLGIPTVMIAGPGFADQARAAAVNSGVPVLRVAQYPGAFASHTRKELLDNTRKVLWPQIEKALTEPISEAERQAALSAVRSPDLKETVHAGDLAEINRHFTSMKWSDGLPIVPPMVDKVEAFLRFTDLSPDAEVAVLPIAHRRALAWHVAVNGVMAGCKPEHMPVLIALTRALGGPDFRRTIASTHAWMPYLWVNGPVARQLGIGSGQGELNGEANIALGRFMALAMMNLSGYYVGEGRMGTFGYPMPWTLAEDEDACRRTGWAPFHVQEGMAPKDSAVTAASALLWGNNMAPSTTEPREILELLAWDIAERGQFALGSGRPDTHRTILLTEPVAAILSRAWPTKEKLEEALMTLARRPLSERARANYFANPGSNQSASHTLEQHERRLAAAEGASLTDAPPWRPDIPGKIQTVPAMEEGRTAILVTGDAARNKAMVLPGGGFSTVKIELPKNWDVLMAELGYPPLEKPASEAKAATRSHGKPRMEPQRGQGRRHPGGEGNIGRERWRRRTPSRNDRSAGWETQRDNER